jgi:hypothetical protein
MKVTSGVFLLVCTPLAMAKSDKAYPKEKVAEFVVEKLDVTSTPAAIRPKREKGGKRFGDYGYVTRRLDDNEALVTCEPPRGASKRRSGEREASSTLRLTRNPCSRYVPVGSNFAVFCVFGVSQINNFHVFNTAEHSDYLHLR